MKKQKILAKIFHSDLYGLQKPKFDYLVSNEIDSVKWTRLKPHTPFYFFIPVSEELYGKYAKFWKMTDIFKISSVGIVTARDKLTIKDSPEEVWQTVQRFSKMDPELAREAYELGRDSKDWRVKWAQNDLLKSGSKKDRIVPILYRPFDIRYTYYSGTSGGFHCRPRAEVMQNFKKGNIALITVRQVAEGTFNHALVCENIVESRITLSNKGIAYIYPLFFYEDGKNIDLFTPPQKLKKKSNFTPEFLAMIETKYGSAAEIEEVFYYIYSLLYSRSYRSNYAQYLKSDFPRIPFVSSLSIFKKLANLGEQLAQLHLLKAKSLELPDVKFFGSGNSMIESVKYVPKKNRIYINANNYFEKIDKVIWDYQIGGYQVLEKWLKDRKGQIMKLDEVNTYCKIADVLKKTVKIQKAIDLIYAQHKDEL